MSFGAQRVMSKIYRVLLKRNAKKVTIQFRTI